MKLPLSAYDWALRHLLKEGDTDLFPTPFEVSALKRAWPSLRKQFKDLDVTSYAWRGGRRFVVPKKMLAFRIATQLDPIDSLVFAAVLYKFGPALERRRIPVADNRVFASRLALHSDGRLFDARPSWHDFWRAGKNKAQNDGCTHVVVADITDFYNQIYHHVLERYLEANLPAPAAKVIKRFLQALSDKVSRGIPVGPHSSHLLGECALDATDRSLLSHGYDFCRYGDDIHIFCSGEEAATGALYELAQVLDNQQRLTLQNEKTRIYRSADYVNVADAMLVDRPINQDEEKVVAVVSKETGGDRYREVRRATLSPADQRLLSTDVLERLLSDYLGASKIDYTRMSWLLRRLAQIGAPGALDLVLSRLAELSPVLGPVARYVMSAVPQYDGNKQLLGSKIVAALQSPIIARSHYLQAVLMDVLASCPELNHADEITARYPDSDPTVRREILRVAASNKREDWLRDRKSEFRRMDEWSRRAFVDAASKFPSDEGGFWLQSVRDNLSSLEKVVALSAFRKRAPKLGEFKISER